MVEGYGRCLYTTTTHGQALLEVHALPIDFGDMFAKFTALLEDSSSTLLKHEWLHTTEIPCDLNDS